MNPRLHRGGLAIVLDEVDDTKARVVAVDLVQELCGSVGGSVVDEYDLELDLSVQRLGDGPLKIPQILNLVVDGDDQRDGSVAMGRSLSHSAGIVTPI